MKYIVLQTYDFFEKRRILFWLFLAALILFCVLAAIRINFEEDITKVLNFSEETREYNTLIQNSKTTSKIILRIVATDPSEADIITMCDIADSLGLALQQECGDLLSDVRASVDMEHFLETYAIITRNFPVFVEPEHFYTSFLDSAFLKKNVENTVRGYLKLMETPGSFLLRDGFMNDPANLTLPYFQKLQAYRSAVQFQTIEGHLFAKDTSCLVVMLYPAAKGLETFRNKQLVDKIEYTVKRFKADVLTQGYDFDYFGGVVVAVGNSTQIKKDTMVTVSFLLVLLLLLIVSLFTKKRMPVLIFSTVGFGFLFSLAMLSLILHSISLIAVGTGAVVLGVVIDYPIHFFTHYTNKENIRETLKQLVTPLLVGSITTIGGFLSLMFTRSELLRDFGLFGCCCLLGSVLFTLFVLPHLIGATNAEKPKTNIIRKAFEKISHYRLDKNRWAVAFICICTPVLLYYSFGITYNSDLYQFNYMSPELKRAEEHFMAMSDNESTVFLISKGRTTEEALANSYRQMSWVDSLRNTGLNCTFMSVTNFIPPQYVQGERVDRWNAYWSASSAATKREMITQVFKREQLDVGAFSPFFDKLNAEAVILPEEDYRALVTIFGSEFLFEGDTLCTLLSQVTTTKENYEPVYAALQQSPYAVILNTRFIADQLGGILNMDFYLITLLTSVFVFVVLFLAYGRIELAVTAFLPMVISWIWILGLMSIFGLEFNIVNIILSAFIFGLGADYCVFVLDSHLSEYMYGKKRTPVVRMSILIAAITSMVGLGSLLLAKHPALHSLGTVSVLGIFSVLFISQTIEPILFRLIVSRPVKRKHAPVSLLTIVNSILTFTYFVVGCIVVTALTGLLCLIPLGGKRRKLFLHYLIYYFIRSLVYGDFVLRKIKINEHRETFDRPAVIICNHQSMLDILYLLTLHPKLVLVTKKWVWKSPIMGFIVRMAGYHTVEDGIENNLAAYQKTIDEGYSIALFPEGSRSSDGNIRRFHKGAFYLAEKLQLDIIPLLTQYAYETLPKGSFAVRPGQMALKIYPRIIPGDQSFGLNYVERTKKMTAFYRRELLQFNHETATNEYCFRKLRNGFMYKGGILENYMRVKVPVERYYELFDTLVPQQGHITDVGCGYGLMSYMLWLKSNGRKIDAYDYDEEKVTVAANCYFNDGSVRFHVADITQEIFERSDCFVVSDVMHYLPVEEQKKVVERMLDQLAEGGSIIIRDADENNHKRHRFNKITEFFSIKLLRFNKTTNKMQFYTFQSIIDYAESLQLKVDIIDEKHLAINKIVILRK